MGATLRHHDDVLVIRTERNLLSLAWYDAPRSGHLRAVGVEVARAAQAGAGAPILLNVVVGGTPRFPEDVRDEGAQMIRDTTSFGAVTAHIIEVDGFVGTATRMFLSSMVLLAQRSPRIRVFGVHAEAIRWLASVGEGWSEAALLQAYAELKATSPGGRAR